MDNLLMDENQALSMKMRKFIAEALKGGFKRKRGQRRNTITRDYAIYTDVLELLYEGHGLTSSATKAGAAAMVCDKYGLEEGTALKAYQRVQKIQR